MIVQCICQQLRTILYGDIKQWQLCEIQFAWSLNPVWHNRQGMHVLKPTEIKELSRILWRENCSGPRLRPHRRNTPSARVPLLTARSVGSIYLFAQFPRSIPHSRQGTAQQGVEWGLIKATNPLFSTALEATFDKLQLIRTTLIFKIIKTL